MKNNTTTETTMMAKAEYALVRLDDSGDFYIQETDAYGYLVSLLDRDGEVVQIVNRPWTYVRSLGPVTGDSDDFHAYVAECPELSLVEIVLDSPNGPKVIAPNGTDCSEILAALPDGWTVADDDFDNGVRLGGDRTAYPLSRPDDETT